MKDLNRMTATLAAANQKPVKSRILRNRLRLGNDTGQSILEFALCAPVLLLVVTGIATFGIALNNYLVMTNAVGTATQYLALQRNVTTNPCQDAANSFVNASPNLNSANLTFSYSLNGTAYGAYNGLTASTCSSSSTSTGAAGNLIAGKPVQMTVTYPCNLSVYGHNYIPSCYLQVQTTEIVQ